MRWYFFRLEFFCRLWWYMRVSYFIDETTKKTTIKWPVFEIYRINFGLSFFFLLLFTRCLVVPFRIGISVCFTHVFNTLITHTHTRVFVFVVIDFWLAFCLIKVSNSRGNVTQNTLFFMYFSNFTLFFFSCLIWFCFILSSILLFHSYWSIPIQFLITRSN